MQTEQTHQFNPMSHHRHHQIMYHPLRSIPEIPRGGDLPRLGQHAQVHRAGAQGCRRQGGGKRLARLWEIFQGSELVKLDIHGYTIDK